MRTIACPRADASDGGAERDARADAVSPLEFDTDNDSAFINETVRDYCLVSGIAFTRCRPYRKNDQAFVEQKNGAVVRRLVGYRRFEGIGAARVLAEIYAASRLFVNFFQPSFKLAEKHRDGAKVHKRYHPPATPYQRLLDDPRTPEEMKLRLKETYACLDPVRLLRDIREAQASLVTLSDGTTAVEIDEKVQPTLDGFLQCLEVIWEQGEARPTSAPRAKQKRGRRRPDPLAAVTAKLRDWFDQEPWRTGRELLERLQVERPGEYPDALLRTLQRRLRVWRSERARDLVFDAPAKPTIAKSVAKSRATTDVIGRAGSLLRSAPLAARSANNEMPTV